MSFGFNAIMLIAFALKAETQFVFKVNVPNVPL